MEIITSHIEQGAIVVALLALIIIPILWVRIIDLYKQIDDLRDKNQLDIKEAHIEYKEKISELLERTLQAINLNTASFTDLGEGMRLEEKLAYLRSTLEELGRKDI